MDSGSGFIIAGKHPWRTGSVLTLDFVCRRSYTLLQETLTYQLNGAIAALGEGASGGSQNSLADFCSAVQPPVRHNLSLYLVQKHRLEFNKKVSATDIRYKFQSAATENSYQVEVQIEGPLTERTHNHFTESVQLKVRIVVTSIIRT